MEITYVKDESGDSQRRTEEVLNLMAQMIELSHKLGRPSAQEEEVQDVA